MTGIWKIGGSLLTSVMLMKYLSANLATYALRTMVILKLLSDLCRLSAQGAVSLGHQFYLGNTRWFTTLL